LLIAGFLVALRSRHLSRRRPASGDGASFVATAWVFASARALFCRSALLKAASKMPQHDISRRVIARRRWIMRWLQAFSKARQEANTTQAVTPAVPVGLY